MKMPEFLVAVKKATPAIKKAQGTGNPEDICNLVLTLALHGLVLIPINQDTGIPQPICTMIYIPQDKDWFTKPAISNCYLIPADQISH